MAIHIPSQSTRQKQQQQKTQGIFPKSALVCVTFLCLHVGGSSGCQRNGSREEAAATSQAVVSVAKAVSEMNHHAAPREQTKAGAGEWGSEQNYTATIRETPTPQPELFELSFVEEPGGARPDRLAGVRVQESWILWEISFRGQMLGSTVDTCSASVRDVFWTILTYFPRCRGLEACAQQTPQSSVLLAMRALGTTIDGSKN